MMRLIDFDSIKESSELPRYPENQSLCCSIEDIDRNSSFIVFISHCWLQGSAGAGFGGNPHPDNSFGDKLRLIIAGITRVKTRFAPTLKKCYIWIDFGCLNQDFNPRSELCSPPNQLENIMSQCDCVFTPLLGHLNNSAPSNGRTVQDAITEKLRMSLTEENSPSIASLTAMTSVQYLYDTDSWHGDAGYLADSWCRLEMLYGQNIPINLSTSSSADRASKLSSEYLQLLARGIRPHILFGEHEITNKDVLLVLPKLQIADYIMYDPKNGKLTNNKQDRPSLIVLLAYLKQFTTVIKDGYHGEMEELRPHGYGVYISKNTDIYFGEWKNGFFHNKGTFVRSTGEKYIGQWNEGDKHGYGEEIILNGDKYKGDFDCNIRHGQGVYLYADGSIYTG